MHANYQPSSLILVRCRSKIPRWLVLEVPHQLDLVSEVNIHEGTFLLVEGLLVEDEKGSKILTCY